MMQLVGTEKQEIAFDYAQRLSDGINIAQVCLSNGVFQEHEGIACIKKSEQKKIQLSAVQHSFI